MEINKNNVCPVCGKYEFKGDEYPEICPLCGWDNTPCQSDDPYFMGGANEISLRIYREDYYEKIKQDPAYRWDEENS